MSPEPLKKTKNNKKSRDEPQSAIDMYEDENIENQAIHVTRDRVSSAFDGLMEEFKQGMKLDAIRHAKALRKPMTPMSQNLSNDSTSSIDSSFSSPSLLQSKIVSPKSRHRLNKSDENSQQVSQSPGIEEPEQLNLLSLAKIEKDIMKLKNKIVNQGRSSDSSAPIKEAVHEENLDDIANHTTQGSSNANFLYTFRRDASTERLHRPAKQNVPYIAKTQALTPIKPSQASARPPKTPLPVPFLQMQNRAISKYEGASLEQSSSESCQHSDVALEAEESQPSTITKSPIRDNVLVSDMKVFLKSLLEKIFESFSRGPGQYLPIKILERNVLNSNELRERQHLMVWDNDGNSMSFVSLLQEVFRRCQLDEISIHDFIHVFSGSIQDIRYDDLQTKDSNATSIIANKVVLDISTENTCLVHEMAIRTHCIMIALEVNPVLKMKARVIQSTWWCVLKLP